MTEPNQPAAPAPKRRSALIYGSVLVFLGLAASAGLYDLKRDIKNLERRTRESLTALNNELRDLQQLKEAQLTANQQREAVLASISALQSRTEQVDSNYARLAGQVQGGRKLWQFAEVEQLLLIANDRLLLQRDAAGALRALELADARLAPIAESPSLLELRQSIAAQLSALRGIPTLDVQGISLRLNTLIQRAPGLPLTSRVPDNYVKVMADAEAPQTGQTRWERFLANASRALSGLVQIRHRDQAVAPLLPPHQEFFLYQNLQLKLESARLALMQRDTAAYQSDIKLAIAWLHAFFKPEDPSVSGAIKELELLEKQELNWPLPDLSPTLEQVRQVAAKLSIEHQSPASP